MQILKSPFTTACSASNSLPTLKLVPFAGPTAASCAIGFVQSVSLTAAANAQMRSPGVSPRGKRWDHLHRTRRAQQPASCRDSSDATGQIKTTKSPSFKRRSRYGSRDSQMTEKRPCMVRHEAASESACPDTCWPHRRSQKLRRLDSIAVYDRCG